MSNLFGGLMLFLAHLIVISILVGLDTYFIFKVVKSYGDIFILYLLPTKIIIAILYIYFAETLKNYIGY